MEGCFCLTQRRKGAEDRRWFAGGEGFLNGDLTTDYTDGLDYADGEWMGGGGLNRRWTRMDADGEERAVQL
jgi:hypothetical protein